MPDQQHRALRGNKTPLIFSGTTTGTNCRGHAAHVPGPCRVMGIIAVSLTLAACTHRPRAPDASTAATPVHSPAMLTETGIWGLPLVRLVATGSRWSGAGGKPAPPRDLHFVRIDRSAQANWHWTILSARRLAKPYKRYKTRRGALAWDDMMRRLRAAAAAIFPGPLPPIHFVLRMVPAQRAYATYCRSFTRNVLRLCYAFPFRGDSRADWAADMGTAFGFLSHETAIAILKSNQWGTAYQRKISAPLDDMSGTTETLATLFSTYFMSRVPGFTGFILPPVIHRPGLPRADRSLRNFMLGGEITGLAMQRAYGGYHVVCFNDRQALDRYERLLRHMVRDLTEFEALEPQALRTLRQPYDAPRVTVSTSHGPETVATKRLNGGAVTAGQADWGGIYGGFQQGQHGSREFERLYARLCRP